MVTADDANTDNSPLSASEEERVQAPPRTWSWLEADGSEDTSGIGHPPLSENVNAHPPTKDENCNGEGGTINPPSSATKM